MVNIVGVGWKDLYKGYMEALKKCPYIVYVQTKYAGTPIKVNYRGKTYYAVVLRCGWEMHEHIPGVTGTYLLSEEEYKYLAESPRKRLFIEMMGPNFNEERAKIILKQIRSMV